MGETVSLSQGHGRLDEMLARWVAHGLITKAQAEQIRAVDAGTVPG